VHRRSWKPADFEPGRTAVDVGSANALARAHAIDREGGAMSPSVVRVMTLNCWHVSEPFNERMTAIRAGIEHHRPDLIGLQEIVVRRDGFDQAAEILAGSGYDHVYGAAFRFDGSGEILPHDADGDGFGNAIASRWPISAAEVRALPGTDSGERRSAIGARIESPHGRIPFVATHLNWKLHHGVVRESQVPAVADLAWELASDADFPPIVVGDLNAEPDSTEIRFLCGLASLGGRSTYFQDAWRVAGDGARGCTWDNRNPYAAIGCEPTRRLDYILIGQAYASGRGIVESAQLVLDQPYAGVYASDHFGLIADVRA
jgi:endonuclease/exonuclease/phosphatase family metal-dependent hydrolase